MAGFGFLDFLFDIHQLGVGGREVDLFLRLGRANVARDVQIEFVGLDLLHRHAPRVALHLLRALLVCGDDLGDVLLGQLVLALALQEMLGGVDEQHVVGLFALLQHEDANRDAGRIEQVRRQADHGVDVPVFQQFLAYALLCPAAEEHAVRQDDRHHAVVFEVVQPVQQKREVGRALRRHAVVLEAHVLAHRLARLPAVAERRIGHNRVELRLHPGVRLAQHVPVVSERVTVVDLELRVLHPVQQHVHARQVVGRDILFHAEDLADGPARVLHAMAHVKQERPRPAGEIEHAFQLAAHACFRLLAVERDDGGQDAGDLLRRVELARFLARAGGELVDFGETASLLCLRSEFPNCYRPTKMIDVGFRGLRIQGRVKALSVRGTNMATALDSARLLIQLGYSSNDPEDSDCLCPLRLQKLLYYVQGWSLALRGRPMFGERIEAWKFGPVIPEIYQRFKPFGFGIIKPDDAGEPENLSTVDRRFIETIWAEYKAYSATKLREMTHGESPWNDARRGLPSEARSSEVISNEALRNFFSQQATARARSLDGVEPKEVWDSFEEMQRGGGRSLKEVVARLKQLVE